MNRLFYSLSLLLLAIFFTIPSAAHATKYSGGTIEIYLSQQQRINLSEMLAEAMDKYGAGYPYSWKSSNSAVFRTTMPNRTHCNVYACGAGTAELTYHGEYYRDAAIHDIDCTWTINVIIKDNGGGDEADDEDSNVTEPIGETWIDDGNYDCSWYSEGLNSFSLSTPEQLAGLSYIVNNGTDFANKTVTLANDISLDGKRWIGIGSVSGKCFKGTFDGKKHTISCLNIAIRGDDDYAGFLGSIDNARIQNLILEGVLDANTACGRIGGLVGHSENSVISNVTCNIPIYINNNLKKYGNDFKLYISIGGIVGTDSYSSINHTKYNGEIILTQYPNAAWYSEVDVHVGGLIGYCNNEKVSFSESKCSEISIESPTWEKYEFLANAPTAPKIDVGGLIGWASVYNKVECCKSQCELINITSHGFPFSTSPSGFIGTLIGFTTYERANNDLTNCLGILKSLKIKENKMDVFFYANNCFSGAFCFCNSDVSISQSKGDRRTKYEHATFYKLEEMKTDAFLDKLNEYSENEFLNGAIWEKADDGFPQLKPNAGMDEDEPVVIYDEKWQDEGNYDTSWFNYTQKEFTINTPQELAGLAHVSLPYYSTIKLGSDIDMSGKMWVGDSFYGITFDGQGHKITGLNIMAEKGNNYAGFFSKLQDSEVKNVTLEGMACGDLCESTINLVGGLAGSFYNGTINNVNCNIDIHINNDLDKYDNGFSLRYEVGGICGSVSNSILSHVGYNGNIVINQLTSSVPLYRSLSAYIGGIYGYSESTNTEYAESRCPKMIYTIPESKQTGSWNPNIYFGTICGSVNSGSLEFCSGICDIMFVDNKVYANGTVGNIIGSRGYYDLSSCITKNCFGIINKISVEYCKFQYYANNSTYSTGCFSNSDVSFKYPMYFQKNWNNVKTYTTDEMKTETFLEQLNEYSIKNLGNPVWGIGEDGFPQLVELHNTSGISPVIYDTKDTKEGVFSLHGTKLITPMKGINIINGKKILVK